MTSLQSAIVALVAQVVALVVGFGIMNSTEGGLVVSVTTAAIAVAFLIAHGLHANAAAKIAAAKVAKVTLPPNPVP